MAALDSLFHPGRIGRLETKNRLVMPPMVRNYADEQGRATPRYRAHIGRIARGGVGTMILEAAYVRPDGRGFVNQLGLHDDAVIEGLASLVEIAHAHGAVIGTQLYHAGRQTQSRVTGERPVAPSAIPDPLMGEAPRALETEEIPELVRAFADAARRSEAAGCDFVEIHGAHGYLITQFLSPFTNQRDDRYGGSFENRLRFLTEVVEAVQGAVSPGFPIVVRLSCDEMVPGGITPEDTVEIARRLEQMGVAALHISVGNYASYARGYMMAPMAREDGVLLPYAEQVKRAVGIPVIAVGKLRDPRLAAEVIESGRADFVAIGRTLLADPDWPNKARDGLLDRINHCIACNQGCVGRLFDGKDVWCTVNPETGREGLFAQPEPGRKLRIAVVGGGPGGMTAAIVAKRRGHDVVLFEKEEALGGQLFAAEASPHRPGWRELREYLTREVTRLRVDVRTGATATADAVQAANPDVAIVAIGASPYRPRIHAAPGANTAFAVDLLLGKHEATSPVVIAGGGCNGAQTAEFLAARGHTVTIVEMTDAVATDAPPDDRALLLQRLKSLGVEIRTGTRIMRVDEGEVTVESVYGVETIPAATVVYCLGYRPNDGLADALRAFVSDVRVIGDAVEARKVTEAVAEGALAVFAIEEGAATVGFDHDLRMAAD
ncbi:MAG TPA: FAD-dependent oxidoreductase [Longimicrobiales bacterium]|nr:FAD-dependent oxidoreductase [Longimicrobiales bacterium]